MIESSAMRDAMIAVTDLAKPLVATGCGLIESLLGEPCKVGGQVLHDTVYAWQWRNRVKIAARAKKMLEDTEIDPRVMPKGFLLPLLDAAGNVEEDTLQRMWASLLAEAVEHEERQHPLYIETLRGLSSSDARFLCEACTSNILGHGAPVRVSSTDLSAHRERISRLAALGLLERVPPKYEARFSRARWNHDYDFREPERVEVVEQVDDDYFRPTNYAIEFFCAVKRDAGEDDATE